MLFERYYVIKVCIYNIKKYIFVPNHTAEEKGFGSSYPSLIPSPPLRQSNKLHRGLKNINLWRAIQYTEKNMLISKFTSFW